MQTHGNGISCQTPDGARTFVPFDGSKTALLVGAAALYQTKAFRAVDAYWNGRTVASHGSPLVVIG